MSKIPEDLLRKLAHSFYYQMIYNRAKELNSIRLFENDTDFTRIQILFLQYLEQISNLYMDLSMDKPLITEEVINDWIRSESYMLYKTKNRDKEELNQDKDTAQSTDKIVFLTKSKKI
jgi:hypothetical protein